MNKIRALVVDDEPMARDRVLSLLQHEEDVEVVGECGDGTPGGGRHPAARRPTSCSSTCRCPATTASR